MNILGVSLPGLHDMDGGRVRDFAQFLEAEGLGGFFSTESNAHDIFTTLAAAAGATETIRLGAAVQPIYTRTPTVAAQSWITLDRLSGGRALVGLGVSSPAIMERWNGVALRRPLRAMREYVEVLRAIFAGGKVNYAGEVYQVDGFRPGLSPMQAAPPIYLAALNPKMLRLAGEIADGVLLNLTPVGEIPSAIAEVESGIAAAGRRREDVHISAVLRVCACGADRASADLSGRMQLLTYVMAPQYRMMFTRHGFGEDCDRLHDRWAAGDRSGALDAIGQPMLDALLGIGEPDKVVADVRRLAESGADSVQLQAFAPPDAGDGWAHVKDTLRAVAAG